MVESIGESEDDADHRDDRGVKATAAAVRSLQSQSLTVKALQDYLK